MNFHQIGRITGERVRHQKVLESTVDSDEAAVVQKDEIVKGYEYRKGQYVTIEPRELDNLRVPSKHVIEISPVRRCVRKRPGIRRKALPYCSRK
ncbi:MAG: Ku protein [Terracidiphilus sp.]